MPELSPEQSQSELLGLLARLKTLVLPMPSRTTR